MSIAVVLKFYSPA